MVFDDEEEKLYTVKDILKHKPPYLIISQLENFRSFKSDSAEFHSDNRQGQDELSAKFKAEMAKYAKFDSVFNKQFFYSAKQTIGKTQYALAQNLLGYWLTKLENNTGKAYFLGLSFSHYYLNRVQTQPIIANGELQLQGSLVKIVKVAGLPGYDDYSALEDGKLFRIKLSDLEKDSDGDAYNDIFEESFGLNSKNEDSDGDGIDDFEDLNPLFASEKNKFTTLFEKLTFAYLPIVEPDAKKLNYFYQVYESDCEYFQRISPNMKTLIITENKNNQPYYLEVTDVVDASFSKLKKDEKNPEKFFITEWNSSSTTDYAVEFNNGHWNIQNIFQTLVLLSPNPVSNTLAWALGGTHHQPPISNHQPPTLTLSP